jgi:hypothetical protein
VVVFEETLARSAMDARTIELDRNDLDKSVEVLSSAAQTFQLTRFESRSYRLLMLSVDMMMVIFFAVIIIIWFVPRPEDEQFLLIGLLAFFTFALAGMFSLVLNIPLFIRVFLERARLKKLGLNSLSRSLWIESRRSRWMSRARSYLLVGVSMFFVAFLVWVLISFATDPSARGYFWDALLPAAAGYVAVTVLLLSARYLRNQRERIDLTANAEELRKSFQSLRQRAGKTEVVTVPSKLVEQTAKIESVQIAEERKDAILQSITSPSKEYAVAFDHEAAERRTTLSVADRIELEDLVEELSTKGAKLESQAGAVIDAKDAMLRCVTKSKRVEIDYLIDQASHRLRITAVRQEISGSKASANGATHA